MNKRLGQSVYLSLIRNGTVSLDDIENSAPVFLSLHIQEEFDENYNKDIFDLCSRLHDKGCRIIADISKNTLKQLKTDIDTLVEKLYLWALRIDYGFSLQEIKEIAKTYNVVLNASTMPLKEILEVKKDGNVMAMHNFYPRKETGLDEEYFLEINNTLKSNGIEVMAFIPGKIKREPLYEGLPTLEKQRFQNTYVNYLEMIRKYDIDQIYLSEPGIDEKDLERIELFDREGIITLPVNIDPVYEYLLNTVLTSRVDSPCSLIRVLESREYSRSNDTQISAANNIDRLKGSITIDNSLYKRYCGEVQITKQDFPKDEKVNVIGKVENEYLGILDMIQRGSKFVLKKDSV